MISCLRVSSYSTRDRRDCKKRMNSPTDTTLLIKRAQAATSGTGPTAARPTAVKQSRDCRSALR